MSIARQALILWTAVAVLVVALGWTDPRRARTGDTGDFAHFYYAADAVRHDRDPYAAHTRGYIYPPLLAFLAQPVAALPVGRAAAVMLAVNVTVTLATVALLAAEFLRRFGAPRRDVAAVAAVVFLGLLFDADKVRGEWQMWQTDVWMLLLFTLALRWLDRRPAWAGIALGLGANLKYLPLLLLPYLLLRRRWTTAAALVISSVIFAVLPAVQVGWATNAANWRTAAAGLTGMAGGGAAGERAEVHGVADSLSCSVTSALARATGGRSAVVPFALAAAVGGALFAAVAVVYRRRGVPLVGRVGPAVTGAEWPVLVAVLLAFSPQTNTRHLSDALIVTTAAAVLLLAPPPRRSRWPVEIGTAVLVAGFTLPPGSRTAQGFWSPTVAWLRAGGPCWCLLAGAAGVLWTGVRGGPISASPEPVHDGTSRKIDRREPDFEELD